ncbi:metalloregulator ArsR/SmtB family transcription factor [Leeia sp. TBRC 13508]|uniref:Metalloregulator ArsR/SmtB family transcription factor n=1 Tax=Leeia speluncae TaxID=2884804 RepID=A0ABS8D1K7_9NEIS|nr:metalloregulator ArsR/SmtB family transcription factor [Leeia speluncae]MCB6182072.1 metalloregulator ArsR/SmtB family transcription factor [Leeia speluncae]
MPTDQHVVVLADLFRLLGDSTRLKIVLTCLEEPVSVSNIATINGLSNSLVSHHLRLLRAARVLKAERQGKLVFYSAADQHISDMLAGMLTHIDEPDEEH